MAFATGAMDSLLPKLGELLKAEYQLQAGVRKKIESLSRELESMHAVLHKVGEVPHDQVNEQVRIWASEVREASYDMEDIVDSFLVRVDGRHVPADTNKLKRLGKKIGDMFKKSRARHKIAGAIQDINDKLDEVSKRRGRYNLDDVVTKSGAKSTIDPRILDLFRVKELIGIDEPKNKVIEKLSSGDGDNKMKIVSIFGFGGLGKTTLAKAVYDKLKHGFDCVAFVPVGQNPDLKKVFKDILIELDKEKYENIHNKKWDERLLMKELFEFLENKRYLIIIDDIWDNKLWDPVRCALPDSNCGSRVVITTRISEVAQHAGDIYRLQTLSREDSQKLLYTRIANDESQCHNKLSVKACNKILNKCAGVPLAIITIASLLASKPEHDWPEVYNSIGFGHTEGNGAVDNTRMILLFSYYNLPSHLKTCLLYLSVFPEDYLIQKDLLIWKWIAEGFVHEKRGAGLFELGERYFNDLVNRSMIQPVEHKHNLLVYGCRVHDMVLDMVRELSVKENFATILENQEQQKDPPQTNARRLALHNTKGPEEKNHQLANMGLKQVRSFVATNCSITVVSPCFEVLRVLALEGCDVAQDYKIISLQHIDSFLHLRYLRIGTFSVLPNGVGNMKFLQTLDLSSSNIKVPATVGQLTQLLCLRTCRKVHADWIGKLTSLQELRMHPCVAAAVMFVKELGKLTDLRVLLTKIPNVGFDARIWVFGPTVGDLPAALLESLLKLHKIQTLEISGGWNIIWDSARWEEFIVSTRYLQSLVIETSQFSRLPIVSSWLVPALSHLVLRMNVVLEQDMETLGRLPELRFLELCSSESILLSIKSTSVGYFCKLRSFDIPHSSVRFDLHVSGCSSSSSSVPAPPPPVMMPRLEVFRFHVHVRYLKDANLLDKLGLLETIIRIPSLREVIALISWSDACLADVEETEAALTSAAAAHPNRPTLQMIRQSVSVLVETWRPRSVLDLSFLKVIHKYVDVREEKDDNNNFDFRWVSKYYNIQKFILLVNCKNARLGEVEEAETAARHAAQVHRKRPTLEITRYYENEMLPNCPISTNSEVQDQVTPDSLA